MNKILPNNQNNSKNMRVTEVSQSFSGPLPPPEILRKFDEVVPGAAERIIKMAEDQSIHRKELEKNSLVGVFMYGSKTPSEERKVKSSKE